HLLYPIHGERVQVRIEYEIRKEDIEKNFDERLKKVQEYIKEHNVEAISLTDKDQLFIKYEDSEEIEVIVLNDSLEKFFEQLIKEIKEVGELKIFKGDKKNIHGIIINKKDES
ncbi:12661_t:CDS:1, partial [Ambispora gerdemannii]